MKFSKTLIDGLFIIELSPFNDLRGQLFKPFNSFQFAQNAPQEINVEIKEVWFTKSKINVIRAMHLQVGALACEKIVSVIKGKVLDVILDIREGSSTYGKVFEIELSESIPQALYIPIGCAHGYKVLQDESIVLYMSTQNHSGKDDVGIYYKSFGYNWNIENPIISEKDKNLPDFGNYKYKKETE
ncbi:dTDP-4-dehydrorhamnose 3,5-epimerase family protein [Psychroflexus lacisalsi]|jgi:dTDP-4-dehydrorhamnose 3,5-epimerase/CDP-3, 6-dideoxy-D-glycero-D-glycero-4-hexulose-5-epimerase|uniref:dTDP-4-dehydrorhamnose 3,5-epimerase n=1 Tax=Psychroflexus lacisalsi TaxID=503928 RepID=A0ABN1K453_9FLAO|nr:dTDP-4-dehydrorhamnose 3,5-epimerase family protein [Psychroflexus lacisalsi]MBZ9618858.1 dTDP-4-dehydrorhamnose 3,5-epimerase family protein [Psychroflexus lacisalsi]